MTTVKDLQVSSQFHKKRRQQHYHTLCDPILVNSFSSVSIMTSSHHYPKPLASSRFVILAAVLGYYFSRFVSPFLLPWGPGEPQPKSERPNLSKIDYSNDLLTTKRKCITMLPAAAACCCASLSPCQFRDLLNKFNLTSSSLLVPALCIHQSYMLL